jgi:DinB superfamily
VVCHVATLFDRVTIPRPRSEGNDSKAQTLVFVATRESGGRKLIAMAEDFPEEKYDFKAAPTARSFAERLIHAAAANYYFTNLALGQKPPAEEDPPRAQFKNKAAVVAYVKKSFADGVTAIKAKGDGGILESVVDPFAQDNPNQAGKEQIRLIDLAHSLDEHSGEVYGQLSVYYRVAGLIPPESRPPQK